MSQSSRYLAGAVALTLFWAQGLALLAAENISASSPWTTVRSADHSRIEWHWRGRKLFSYALASHQFKPYVRELFTLSGTNVLRDAPADHLHHHGLMYAIRVNGVNFWEERDQPGHERHLDLSEGAIRVNERGQPEVRFTEQLLWAPDGEQRATEAAALLLERRTLRLAVDERGGEVALAWQAEFTVGGRTNRITLHGSEYNGLGLRLPAEWDRVARHVNSEGAAPPNGGKPGAVPARWSAVASSAAPGAVQVALFARPGEADGTNAFFTMTEPFTYLSATQSLDKQPREYRSGQRFHIDYLLLIYSAARSPAQLEERYQSWLKERPDPAR